MGLLLSVLITCVGVLEAVTVYHRFVKGMIPEYQPAVEGLARKYDRMFADALSHSPPRSEEWKRDGQGYLHITGSRREGSMVAAIKYFGGKQDTASILFSTKISSFGQESIDTDTQRYSASPEPDATERYTYEKTEHQHDSLKVESNGHARQPSPSFWDDEGAEDAADPAPSVTPDPEPREKLQWHYRPLTPTDTAALPEIHFNSYERKSSETGDQSAFSNEFLRSLDGVKFRPLQRDDGTGRRRSFKKRHSSSSNSSRDSKASREEELRIFTSLEEAEFENHKVQPDYASAPGLSVGHRSPDRKSKSPVHSLSPEDGEVRRDSRSLSIERRRLMDLPQVSSFEELPNEERAQEEDFALSKLKSADTENDDEDEDDDEGVTY